MQAMMPERTDRKLLICIPACNEEESIGQVLDSLLNLENSELFDILVVDDASQDATREICKSRNIWVITHLYNMGYGAALKTAYKYAAEHTYDYIIQIDADGQHDVANIQRIYSALTESEIKLDIVIGSRFLQNSVSFPTPFYKKLVISIFKLIIKFTTNNNITDPTSGLQGLTRRAFLFYAQFDRFAVDYPDANMIIQMALNDFKVEEIPAIMYPRVSGESMHAGIYKPFKYVVKMTLSVLITYMRESSALKRKKN